MAAFKAGKKEILIATDVAARGIDVDDVTHVINHTVPDDEKTYLHRVGRTGRAGRTGIAVTFVDWDDMHKWALINKALDFGIPEPRETYSSSPHLYEELKIPEGTKGRLKATPVKERAPRRANDSGADAASGEGGDGRPSRNRNRRRTRSDNPRGGGRHEAHGHEGHGHDDEGKSEPGASNEPLSDDGASSEAPRRRRRRRGGRGRGQGAGADAVSAEGGAGAGAGESTGSAGASETSASAE
jgi:superfamily II DNA/RNA helicase